MRGLIASGWQHDGGTFRFTIDIPPNASACIRVPSSDPEAVRDGTGERPAGIAEYPGRPGVREAVFEVGSGAHEFAGPLRWASPVQ